MKPPMQGYGYQAKIVTDGLDEEVNKMSVT
jgi:hypothetical protein